MSKRTDIIEAIDHLDAFRELALDLELLPKMPARPTNSYYLAVVNMRMDLHKMLGEIERELMGVKE